MPTIKDTEWRVLCVVVRQTLGWREKGGARRTRDWLTQQQLKRRTGRNTEALSKAIAALTAANLLEVRDGHSGVIMASSASRRRHRGKLYFGLHPAVLVRLQDQEDKSKIERTASKVEFRKSNTTKETGTKEIVTKALVKNVFGSANSTECTASAYDVVSDAASTRRPEDSAVGEATPEISDRQVQRLLQLYRESFFKFRPKNETPKTAPLDRSSLSQVLAVNDEQTIGRLLRIFFTRDIGYVRQQGYSLQAFVSSVNILKLFQ